ncbi:Aldo-keto reductase family 1 member C4 [Manis javanica]|nr:Aldo-keto reductase family 1 member C4 [Manis javanica]
MERCASRSSAPPASALWSRSSHLLPIPQLLKSLQSRLRPLFNETAAQRLLAPPVALSTVSAHGPGETALPASSSGQVKNMGTQGHELIHGISPGEGSSVSWWRAKKTNSHIINKREEGGGVLQAVSHSHRFDLLVCHSVVTSPNSQKMIKDYILYLCNPNLVWSQKQGLYNILAVRVTAWGRADQHWEGGGQRERRRQGAWAATNKELISKQPDKMERTSTLR